MLVILSISLWEALHIKDQNPLQCSGETGWHLSSEDSNIPIVGRKKVPPYASYKRLKCKNTYTKFNT